MLDLIQRSKVKKEEITYRKRVSTEPKINGRSADYIFPSFALGCQIHCFYCVSTDTLIASPLGDLRISDIQDNQDVFSYIPDEKKLQAHPCVVAHKRTVDEYYELVVGSNTLLLTGEHPVLTQRGWVEAKDLDISDEVLCVEDDQ